MNALFEKVATGYVSLRIWRSAMVEKHGQSLMLILGAVLLTSGLSEISHAQVVTYSQAQYDPTLVQAAVGSLFALVEGSFGALIMVAAGLAAIVAAAMGAYRAAVSLLVVAVGAFILRALVSLFFGSNFAPIADQVNENNV